MVNPEVKNLYVDSSHLLQRALKIESRLSSAFCTGFLYDAVSNLLTVTCVAEEIMCSALQQW